ncbi:hypothetical protein [Ruminococcus sp.]|uniref:hypothetical protein n=1 Tax=Ruminococcus sp. TaxID=41978 RepID=UPI0025CCAD77|nr:hypothetical protein [Ruminococcus sp.]MBQ8965024.1 hypothetical protein [Ruminococcus sp.]
MRNLKAAAAAAALMLLAGCSSGRTIDTITTAEFKEALTIGGYGSADDGFTTDSEDGTTTIMQAKSGWLVGFYECRDSEVAETEFYSECGAADIEETREGKNYICAEKESDDEYLYYIAVDDTCLFVRGKPENSSEIEQFTEDLGYKA